MKNYFGNHSLRHQVLVSIISIMLITVIIVSSISFFFYNRDLKNHFKDDVVLLAFFRSSIIDGENVEKTIASGNVEDGLYSQLHRQLSLLEEKESSGEQSMIVSPAAEGKKVFVIIPSEQYEAIGARPFSYMEMPDEYINGLKKAIEREEVVSSDFYHSQDKTLITSFAPIKNDEGKMIALLTVDADASIIYSQLKKIAYFGICMILLAVLLFFIIVRTRLKTVFEPVEEIIKGINEVSNGNFQVKLQLKKDSRSEMARLIERFNYMTGQLSNLYERLSLSSEQLGHLQKNENYCNKIEAVIGSMNQIIQETKIMKELQRAEKMNAIGQLAASVAHEIRNPMTVVKGFLQIFLSKDELSQEERMFVKLMIDEMNRAETIINDYLSLAKPDIEATETVDAGKLANKVADLMNSYAMMSKNIEIQVHAPENIFVRGNKSELQQVLINIVKNGIEAMKDGGSLYVRVRKDDHYGIFEIEDTGIGMTPEEMDRLGTAFYSLKEKGTGMGLMVCYQIVERMKGEIKVKSKLGEGTTFYISIPLEKEMGQEDK